MDALTQMMNSFHRGLLGLSSKDSQFRADVYRFAKRIIELWPEENATESSAETPIPRSHITACNLKSEAVSHLGVRSRGSVDSESLEHSEKELREQANSLNCYLWMLDESFDLSDLDTIDSLAGCFDTLADALTLVNEYWNDATNNQRLAGLLLRLVAKSQSALKEAVRRAGGPEDPDQKRAFQWLRGTTDETQIYISRHMKQDDPAPPEQWPEIVEEIEAFRMLRMKEAQRHRQIQELFDDLSSLSSRLHDANDYGLELLWSEIDTVVDELVSLGVPPSSLEFRELLVAHIESASDHSNSENCARVYGYLRRGHTPVVNRLRLNSRTSTTAAVEEIGTLLRGRSLLLIGGDERSKQRLALKKALKLKDVLWLSTKHGTSVKSFEPYVAQEDVAVVLLAIRWSSHSYGEVSRFCNRYGKPLVRLPGGYSPEQIVYQIRQQCSDRLRELTGGGSDDR